MLRSRPSCRRSRWCGDHVVLRRVSTQTSIVADFDRESAHIVGKQVERAAAGEVEAGVMPVAGQDAVAHRAAIERKAHVRAAIIDGVDLIAVEKQDDRMPVNLHRKRPLPRKSDNCAACTKVAVFVVMIKCPRNNILRKS